MKALALPRRLVTVSNPFLVLGMVIVALAIGILPLSMAAALVVGTAALLLTLARLEYGLALLAFTVPFGSLGEIDTGDFSLSATEFIVPLVVLGWVLRMIASRQVRISAPWVVWPLLLFLSTMALSLTNSVSPGLSLKEIAKWTEFLAVLVLISSAIKEKQQVKFLVGAVLVAGAVAALHGWYQFILREGPPSFLVSDQFLRAYGFYGQPNPFAGYLLSVAPLALALLLVAYRKHLPWKPLFAAFFIVSAAILMTLSRGGMMGLAGASALIAAVWRRDSKLYLVLALLVISVFSLAISYEALPIPGAEEGGPLADFGIFDPSNVAPTPQNWSVVERMALWYSAWNMWKDSPWLGIGIGNFRAIYPHYALPKWNLGQEHAHNFYLNVLTEAGAVGFAAYLVFLASIFTFAARALKSALASGWHLGSGLAMGLLAVLVALSLHNFFDNIYVHGMLVQMGILLGLAPVASRLGEVGG
ncbi:MAG: O-antigen ligase family protein [Dehalococcoidia bacterium]|nr:O-antigen ligase family protein [Dehalococcoidia bacterium]